jgi:hypothetical protein
MADRAGQFLFDGRIYSYTFSRRGNFTYHQAYIRQKSSFMIGNESIKSPGKLNLPGFFTLNDDELDLFCFMAAAGLLVILLLFLIIF